MILIKKLPFLFLLFIAVSCSDGTQLSQRIDEIIVEKKITKILVRTDKGTATKEYLVKDITIDEQLIAIDNEFINLGTIKTMKVSGDQLELNL